MKSIQPTSHAQIAVTIALLILTPFIAGQGPCQWQTLGAPGSPNAPIHPVAGMFSLNDGSGDVLYTGESVFASQSMQVRKWDGTSWTALPGQFTTGPSNCSVFGCSSGGYIGSMTFYDPGSGPALFVGGYFTGPTGGQHLARWNGSSWTSAGVVDGAVRSMAVFDDGSGPALFVVGDFTTIAGTSANGFVKWNGSSFSAVDVGGPAHPRDLTVIDDGSGPKLIVGTYFNASFGSCSEWNGTSWSLWVGNPPGGVLKFLATDLGNGPELHAVGMGWVARRVGSTWITLDPQLLSPSRALTAFDDGTGLRLFTPGTGGVLRFNDVFFAQLPEIAPSGAPSAPAVWDVATFNDGTGEALYASGHHLDIPGVAGTHKIVKLSCPPPSWQWNTEVAAIDIDGAQADPFDAAATTQINVGSAGLFSVASSLSPGTQFDILANLAPVIPRGHPNTVMTATQLINLDLLQPTTVSVFGGSLGSLAPFPGGFSVPLIPASPGTLSAQMIILDPGSSEGFTLSQAVQANLVGCALTEDFETAVVGIPGVYPSGWTNGVGAFPWRVHTGGTTTPGTGPTGDHTTGSGKYIYCEADLSPGVGIASFIIDCPPTAAAGLSSPQCEFWFHLNGSNPGQLQLEQFDGSSWSMIWSANFGDVSPTWQRAQIPLTITGPTIQLRLGYFLFSAGGLGDCAIDDFKICG